MPAFDMERDMEMDAERAMHRDKNDLLYEKMDMMDQNLPILLHKDFLSKYGDTDHFDCHWHDTVELLYFTKGEALIKCNSLEISAKEGDLIVINSNELHQGCCISESVEYYCIIFSTSLLQSRHEDTCETKYISPISQNRILFKNKIENDEKVSTYIHEFVKEYESKKIGYEMAIKATLYQLLVLLLRNHAQLVLTTKEYTARMKNLSRLNIVLEYLENHFNEQITLNLLCSMTNISRFYFCRLFKSITGKAVREYLNQLRVNKAEALLEDGDVNVTETALLCGFDDVNYFSRLFKKYKNKTPSSVLQKKK